MPNSTSQNQIKR